MKHMKRMMIVLLAILIMPFIAQAQDHIFIPPPAHYMEACRGEHQDLMLRHFGPNCLNPVTWDLEGFRPISTWVFFLRDDGTTDGGVIVGYMWQPQEGRYHYWLMTQMPHAETRFGGRFENIPPEKLIG